MSIIRYLHLTRALHSRAFALLWLGQTVSVLGNAVFLLAIGWQTLQLTHSATATAIVETAGMLPGVVLLVFGGVAADRLPRRLIMFLSDIGCGLAVLLIAFLTWTHDLHYWHLVGLVGFFGITSSFFGPAYASISPQLVDKDALTSANALRGLSRQLSGLLGPLLSVSMISFGGFASVYAFDGLTFLVSAACLHLMYLLPPGPDTVNHGRLKQNSGAIKHHTLGLIIVDARDGLRYMMQVPWLWISEVVFIMASLGIAAPVIVALPKLITSHYHAGAWLLGAYVTARAIGSMLAILLVGQLSRIRHRGLLVYLTSIMSSMGVVALGWFSVPIAVIIVGIFMGFFGGLADTWWPVLIQEYVPADKLGRVSSVDQMGASLIWPLGFFLAGELSDTLGPSWVFIVGGLFSVLLRICALSLRDIRHLE
ncbi:MFS transporter [Dictyobacter alpinus]|uniref:MFS transporter n=1 Tax=Dictyobacter alpinus TaxID=2014873 RepID=A0A402BHI8_9CHLR|nr:MFS transporter [Dictyobacter alpinus]GCE30789.1 MFS transporter [Dictyobacter alpinus]